jgi:uncharacterized protein YggU (UPF0235/DUF167 family)
MGGVPVQVRVTPGARRASIGPAWAGDPQVLAVAVRERAADGAANRAVAAALAKHLAVAPSSITLVAGPSARRKRFAVTVTGPAQEAEIRRRLRMLLDHGDASGP